MARSLHAVEPDEAGDRGVPVVSLSPPRRRRPSWVLAGAVMVVLAALLGVYALRAVTEEMSVMVAAHDLAAGEPITASDLRVVTMGQTAGLRAVQPDEQDLILGRTPRAAIPAGTVLNIGLFVAPDGVLPAGQVVVGASLGAGEVPTPTLRPGDRVDLVVVAGSSPSAAGVTPDPAGVAGSATVWSVTDSAAGEGAASAKVWVSLLIDESLQARVAQAAADGRLRLSWSAAGS